MVKAPARPQQGEYHAGAFSLQSSAALFLSHPGIKSRKAPCNHLQSGYTCSIIKVECFPFTCAISSMRNEIEEELLL